MINKRTKAKAELAAARHAFECLTDRPEPATLEAYNLAERRVHNATRFLALVDPIDDSREE